MSADVRLDSVPDASCDQQSIARSSQEMLKEARGAIPIAARLNTAHMEPQIPNEDLLTTGKGMWYVAPMRPVMATNPPAIIYPSHTHSHDCHHERPGNDHGRRDHPCVNVKGVRDPECHKGPACPFSPGWFNWFKVIIDQLAGGSANVLRQDLLTSETNEEGTHH